MNKIPSAEQRGGLGERLTIIALFAGIVAVGASLFKNIFGTKKKGKKK